jgi:hypothetical protein
LWLQAAVKAQAETRVRGKAANTVGAETIMRGQAGEHPDI